MSAEGPIGPGEAKRLFAPLARGEGIDTLVIACSGGPDSTALLGLYAAIAGREGFSRAVCATVDHGLRPESLAEAEAVGRFAATLGIPHCILRWAGAKPRSGVQQAARAARYDLLVDHAQAVSAQAIVTAHTLDDQAETVLMRLLRGSGPRGLAAMAERTEVHGVPLLRPLLGVVKARLVATCRANDWPFVNDPSNESAAFLRPRLRRLMPALAQEGLDAARLARLAQRLRRANAALDELTATWRARASRAHGGYDAAVLAGAPDEVLVRFFAALMAEARAAEPDLPAPKLDRIETLSASFRDAVAAGKTFGRTLGGLKFAVRDGCLKVAREPARRSAALRQPAAKAPHKLGNDALRP